MSHPKTPVLVVGAGPVGLIAALDLAWRGVDVTVVETREAGEPPAVKCNHVSARTMEIMRRLGLADRVRRAGLPSDFPNDVAYLTSVIGVEFARIPIPSVEERREPADGRFLDADWPTPEPPHRINQLFFEPILFESAAAHPRITIANRTRLEHFTQTEDGVVATVCDLDSGENRTIACDYLIGCDGARSLVRKSIGAEFSGNPQISRTMSTFIRAPGLRDMIASRRRLSWMSQAINPRRSGNLVAVDGKDLWLIHCGVRKGEEFAEIDRDRAIRTVLGVDDTFRYEVLSQEDWVARRMVASKMRQGRVFICGDAAHIWIPVAGYGMNCGIADAVGLTWMLAAVEKGWAPPALLDAFERERHPISEQVSHFVADLGISMSPRRTNPPAEIDAEGPEGEATRARFGREIYEMNVEQFCCAGLNFGYFYDASPIIAYDGEPHPAYSMGSFTPSTVPGCRLPHFWLPDGRSLYDVLGPDYTLLRLDPAADAAPIMDAAARAGLPTTLVGVAAPDDLEAYRHALVLVRPDGHVAWRGDRAEGDLAQLMALLAGAAAPAKEGVPA